MLQQDSETIDQFVTGLMRQADNCMFEANKNEQIRDWVIDKCRSSNLKRKLLEKCQNLTLEQVQLIARSSEAAEIKPRKWSRKPKHIW